MDSEIKTAAERLSSSAATGIHCEPIRELIGVDAIDHAYAIQKLNVEQRISSGEKPVGYKIGLTSEKVQAQFGIDQPDYGVLFDTMLKDQEEIIAWDELMQPRVEVEIAFIVNKDLNDENLTMDDMRAAIGEAACSIEIVGSRIRNWDIKIVDTIADNASASHYVLSDKRRSLEGFDLEGCKMTLYKGDELVSEGKGSDCMGSPLISALWLAKKMQELGNPIRKDDVLMTGALGPMVGVNPGDEFQAKIEGLGEVMVKFGDNQSDANAKS